jgi:hypothetical protein
MLPVRVRAVPEVVAVAVDGGHLRTRAPGWGPGVHQPQNKEEKLACLVRLASTVQTQDPQPEPPPSFQEPRRVQQMQGMYADKPQEEAVQERCVRSGTGADTARKALAHTATVRTHLRGQQGG